jgi:predicted RNA-binding protein with PIN domain
MPYLIDGHNLIPNIPGMSLENLDDEQQLIDMLLKFCRLRRQKAEVYFDRAPFGQAKSRQFGLVRAHFVSRKSSADHAIMQRLARIGREAPNWKVVTSDRQVQEEARHYRAEVIASEAFASMLLESSTQGERDEQPVVENPDEIDEWLRIFSKRNKK